MDGTNGKWTEKISNGSDNLKEFERCCDQSGIRIELVIIEATENVSSIAEPDTF